MNDIKQAMEDHAYEDAKEIKAEIDWALRDEDYKDRMEDVYDDSYEPTCGTPEPNFMQHD